MKKRIILDIDYGKLSKYIQQSENGVEVVGSFLVAMSAKNPLEPVDQKALDILERTGINLYEEPL